MEFRHSAEVSAHDIQREIEAITARVSGAYPGIPAIEVEKVNAYPGLNTDLSDAAVARAGNLAAVWPRLGKEPVGIRPISILVHGGTGGSLLRSGEADNGACDPNQ